MKRLALALASCAVLLAGCQQRHYTIEAPPPSSVPTPSGQAPAHSQVLSGTAGPLTRAGIGHYMDGLETDLRSLMRGKALIARRGDILLITISSDTLFSRMALSSDGRSRLSDLARVLAHYDHTAIEIGAYTDSTGTPEQNLSVSQKRAEMVAQALTQGGVAATRLGAKGYGATNFKVSNTTDARNRRVELRITPKPG